MTAVRRPGSNGAASTAPALAGIIGTIFILLVYLLTVSDDVPAAALQTGAAAPRSLRHSVVKKRQQLKSALQSLTTNHIPPRLAKLRETSEIVGERLGEIRAGTETVEEVLHGQQGGASGGGESASNKPPMELDEIVNYLTTWIHTLHEKLVEAKHESYQGIWQAYHDLAVKTLYLWDREYLERMPVRRDDGSIYLSIATYRDENCPNTIKWAFEKAKNPEMLTVGLVQQNCHANCRSGIMADGKTEVRYS